jgi:gamma-glutamyltranspeptidase / glutathione hydrolase
MRLVYATFAAATLLLSLATPIAVSTAAAQQAAPQAHSAGQPWLEEKPVRARHGMVVSVHHLASDAGLQTLRQGGNAVDAAVATGFALAVVHPIAGNLGGGGFLLLRTHDGLSTFIDFREKAPLASTRDMYLDSDGNVIPDASVTGYRSIATPGSVAGLVYAERKYGRLSLKRVTAPAIRLAEQGFVLSAEEARELSDSDLARFPESKRIFQRNGNLYKAGDLFRQPELARTLRRIAADPGDFYHGKMARELVDELHKGGALLTLDDLSQYSVVERAPIVGSFHNYTILSAPLPSSGGVVLLSALNMLEGYDLARLGDRSAASMHLIAEAFRRAYMDRAQYLGDPDYNDIPAAALTSKTYADAWRAGIEANHATASTALLRPAGFLPPAPATEGRRRTESNDTTHYSIVDGQGNAVSVTTTINDNFGSRVTAGSLGFLLNDEMDDFAVKPDTPNAYGLIQGPADAIAPGKRPLSAMTPTIVLENGKLRYVLGSPGGSRIISTVTNIFISAAVYGLNIQQAVDAPRFHHQYLPDKLSLEPGFPPEIIADLRARGYDLELRETHWSNGECIAVDPVTGELDGGQDHRSHFGKASGY